MSRSDARFTDVAKTIMRGFVGWFIDATAPSHVKNLCEHFKNVNYQKVVNAAEREHSGGEFPFSDSTNSG